MMMNDDANWPNYYYILPFHLPRAPGVCAHSLTAHVHLKANFFRMA